MLLSEAEVDRISRRAVFYFLLSLLIVAVNLKIPRGLQCGWVTALILLYASIGGVLAGRWRVESGVWMPMVLISLPVAGIFTALIYQELRPFLGQWPGGGAAQPAKQAPLAAMIGFAVDVSIACHLAWRQLRFGATVVRGNWSVKRSDWQAYLAGQRLARSQSEAPNKFRTRPRLLFGVCGMPAGIAAIHWGQGRAVFGGIPLPFCGALLCFVAALVLLAVILRWLHIVKDEG